MFTTVAIIAVVIAGFLVFVARKPDVFSIQRTASIKAPPEAIFPLIRDFQSFISWSPFEKDPNVKRSFKGPATGKGAIYEWDGNRAIGAGSVEIVDVAPPSKIAMKLSMLRPFKSENRVEGQFHQRDLGDARPAAVHREAHGHLHELRKDVRHAVR